MKRAKLLLILIFLLLMTSCNSNEKNTTDTSTQINLSKEKIDTTETTNQKEKVNIDFIYGEWQSINEEKEYYLVIDKINDMTITYSNNLERKDSQELIIEQATKDSVTALTKDEKTRYSFLISNDEILTSFFGVNASYYADEKSENIPAGLSKPIEYTQLIKCGTEEVSTGFSDTLNEVSKSEEK